MQRALALARSVLGRTSPNPAVGAVVMQDSQMVGEGATQPPGGDHAEILALRAAGARAEGATLVVTLEPCNHRGRTPACSSAILRAGIARVVVATRDPNPGVAGRGLEYLAAHGVQVDVGLCGRPAAELNYGFFKLMASGRPFVIAKWAMTLDGKIARPEGGGAITDAQARREVFRLRDSCDAVLVGVRTAWIDDPRLTVRPAPADGRQPLRVVLDSMASLPTESKMLREPGSTLVCITQRAPAAHRRRLEAVGAELVVCPADAHGRVSADAALAVLGERGIANLLVEGGANVLGALFAEEAVDRVVVFVAPRLMGDGLPAAAAGAPTGGRGLLRELDGVEVRRLGPDVMIAGYLRRYDPPDT